MAPATDPGDVFGRVVEYLGDAVPNLVVCDESASFRFGSTRLEIAADALDDQTTGLHISACVATEVPSSPALYKWLIDSSETFTFGRWHCIPSRFTDSRVDLSVRHVVVANHVDLHALRVILAKLASLADALDDQVVESFGGRRFLDEEQQRDQ